MAFYSFVMYAGNGSNRTFAINFPYLDKSHVKAKINSAPTTAFSWLTDSSIQFTTAPAAGAVIEIYRETPQNSAPVDFTDGSVLLERDLDLLATFNLYVGQESSDKVARAIAVGSDGAFNALGLRVSNAADPVNDQDLVTKKWAETSVRSSVGQAQAAKDEAISAKDTVVTASNTAVTKATEAINSAASALDSKNSAAGYSTTAINAKTQAVYARNDAQTAATAAATSATSANAAAVDAATARDTAVSAKDTTVSARDTAVSAKDTAVQAAADAQAATPGAVKVSNTDTTVDKLNNKLTVVAPLSKTVKNGGANEQLELGINLSNYATKASNTYTDAQIMPNILINSSSAVSQMYKTLFNDTAQFGYAVTLKHNTAGNNLYLDCQASADTGSTNVGLRWANAAGNIKFMQYYTPATGVMQNYATEGTAEYRWGIQGVGAAMSLKRNASGAPIDPDYYALNVGDPGNNSWGASLNLYGASVNNKFCKITMNNSNNLRGGMVVSDTDFAYFCTSKHVLGSLAGEEFLSLWRDRAELTFSSGRNNIFKWQNDGNIVLNRNGVSVWAINNYIASDVRLKTDIKPLEGSSLEKVKQLSAKTYLWKNDLMGKGDTREIGLIAQDVANVIPEAVSKMSSGGDTLGIAYMQLVPVLVEAIKELSAKVEALEAQLVTKE